MRTDRWTDGQRDFNKRSVEMRTRIHFSQKKMTKGQNTYANNSVSVIYVIKCRNLLILFKTALLSPKLENTITTRSTPTTIDKYQRY
jgi:hypothetical protein